MIEYDEAATLEIEDEVFIKTIFGSIAKEKTSVWDSYQTGPVDVSYFVLNINPPSQMITDEYIYSVSIFEDGSAFLYTNNQKTKNKSRVLKVNLTTNDFEYVQRYFDDHKSK